MKPAVTTDARWIPGCGPDVSALARLRARFPRPAAPMGEAWFMSERRRMFDGLMAPDPAMWSDEEVARALCESASGPVCFGHLEEWSAWFPYLLHASIGHVGPWRPGSVFSGLVTNMMVHCPNRAACPYGERFIDDALDTLGRLPMDPRFWSGGHLIARSAFQPVQRWPVGVILANKGDLHAAYWLMAKYLRPERFEDWLRSVMAIEDPAWGCGFLSWLAHAEPVFEAPASWPGAHPDAAGFWMEAHLLKGEIPTDDDETTLDCGPFLEPERVTALLSALARTLDPQRFDEWRHRLALRDSGQGELTGAIREMRRLQAAVQRRHRPS